MKIYQEHSDYYDRQTVDDCRRMLGIGQETLDEIQDTSLDAEAKRHANAVIFRLTVYFLTGERALKKDETIRKWIDDERRRELREMKRREFLERVRPRMDVSCLRCSKRMNFELKHLDDFDETRDRAILFYACPDGCVPNRAFFDDGSEYRRKPFHCEKCNAVVMEVEHKRDGDTVTTTRLCISCGFDNEDVLDLSLIQKETPIDEHFAEDREKYCLSDEATNEYRSQQQNLKNLQNILDRVKNEKADQEFEYRLKAIKTLKVSDLAILLVPLLKAENFISLELANPTIANEVRVKFSVQDSESGRVERTAVRAFRVTVEKALADTNWRLHNSSVTAALGILTGEFRGCRNETEVRHILKTEMEESRAEKQSDETVSNE